jgi:hypothetical protein
MRKARRQSKPTLGTDNFDSAVVEAAWTYHQQIGVGYAKGNVSVEVAAFVAGACWARQVLVAEKEGQLRSQ